MKRIISTMPAAIIMMMAPWTASAKCYLDGQWYESGHQKCIEAFPDPEEEKDEPVSADTGIESAPAPTDQGDGYGGASIAVDNIERRRLVRDAAYKRHGDNIILQVAMNAAVNRHYARETGEAFMRQFITFSDDETGDPGKLIGETKYGYNINIVDPRGNLMYSGAKIRIAKRITW